MKLLEKAVSSEWPNNPRVNAIPPSYVPSPPGRIGKTTARKPTGDQWWPSWTTPRYGNLESTECKSDLSLRVHNYCVCCGSDVSDHIH